jgi:hypothetical protein
MHQDMHDSSGTLLLLLHCGLYEIHGQPVTISPHVGHP